MILKSATGYTRLFFMVQAADHHSPLLGAAPTVNISKAGAGFVVPAGAVSEVANGWYKVVLGPLDTNVVGDLAFHITAALGDPTDFADQVQATVTSDIFVDASGNVSVSSSIKKGQALNGFQFVMTDSTTHGPKTGLTVSAQRSLGGAGFAPCANAVSEMTNGVYVINLAATDTNANSILYRFTAVGADDLDILILTQP